ncbi:MAG TPA: di-heme oxidoredictase family protein [Kofleriaceae bacterium]|nr:di-heme oxidoredictase family protein [Kofleriaceae bacterium]
MKNQYSLFATCVLLPASLLIAACSHETGFDDGQAAGLGDAPITAVASANLAGSEANGLTARVATEAPTGFDTTTNGFSTQADMDAARDVFEEVEQIADGLGPVYNAQSCRECHQNPITGAASQVTELRAGHFNGISFVDHPGGSLLDDRAIDPSLQERIAAGNEVRTFRLSLSLLGDGFVEAIDAATLQNISLGQPAGQRGTFIQVPVLEAPGSNRGGRFGWKNQHASLMSFAADAYVNEMGITSPLIPVENTSNGNSVAAFDTVADPEDKGPDIAAFTLFMRSLKAPSRDTALAATASATHGSQLFDSLGCATCHVRSITTAPAGTVINGGQLTVPPALGDKIIHPYSDFLLHDVGTGDGIVQNGGQGTRNKVRTAPLWGMRVRDRLMHDGASVSRSDAILRHSNEAAGAASNFANLSTTSQNDLINFLNSL